jgi:outer membrane lipoprotein SlyB
MRTHSLQHSLTVGLCTVVLSACVSQSRWTPTVDTYGDSRAQYVTRDQQECRQLAMQVSGSSTGQAAQGAVVGGLLGAAAGAAIGAAAGSAGRGAAIGAAAGGIGTGAVRGVQSNQAFQRAFNQCMRNRGHTVLS